MRNEVRILQTLKHPNVVTLISYDSLPSEYVLVFPFYPCGDLFQLLAKRGPIPETMAQGILSQLVRALHYLHTERGIVHRDVKLENILVESMNGAVVTVVLADFGLVRLRPLDPTKCKLSYNATNRPKSFMIGPQ